MSQDSKDFFFFARNVTVTVKVQHCVNGYRHSDGQNAVDLFHLTVPG